MDKQEVYEYLDSRGVEYEISEHKAVYNMAELAAVELPYPDDDAKNLFVRDDKKRNYYLITVRGDKRINLKAFRKAFETRSLQFASEADLMSIMGLIAGAVTPLGLLNDDEHKVKLFIDSEFLDGEGRIGVHPNDNTATVWLKAQDLINLITEHGNPVTVFETAALDQSL